MTPKKCPDCSAELPPDSPLAACPVCLLRGGLDADSDSEPPESSPTETDPDLRSLRSEPIPIEPGNLIDRYQLQEKIGEGGFGAVYLATQTEPVKRRVALKVIKAGMDSKEIIARFEAERQALALMDHPNIAKVHDAGTTDNGRPYFVMELVDGIPITRYCADQQLDVNARLGLFCDVCAAVQHAHQKGVIHRDLKPSNILVSTQDGNPTVKVIDFGIAKAISADLTDKTIFTQLGQVIGTPQYMSPEQAELNAVDVDTRSDIYSLGVLLYELLTGTPPIDSQRLRSAGYGEIQRLIREEPPVKPSTRLNTLRTQQLPKSKHRIQTSQFPRELDWITMKALEKDRNRRYETPSALAEDIGRHLQQQPVFAGPPTAGYRIGKFVRRNRVALAAAMTLMLILVAATVISTGHAARATKAEKRATEESKRALTAEGEAAAKALAESAARQEAEDISEFMFTVLQSPDPDRNGYEITVAEVLSKAAEDLETRADLEPGRRARLQLVLGITFTGLGLYTEALSMSEKSLTGFRDAYGADHPSTLSVMNNLGVIYGELDRKGEAIGVLEMTMESKLKVFGPNHPESLKTMHNLATAYSESGRQREALGLRKRVLKLTEARFGLENRQTITAMDALALSLKEAGHQGEALRMNLKALELSMAFSEGTPSTPLLKWNRASFLSDSGKHEEALELQREVVDLLRSTSGPTHPDTLRAMSNLAAFLLKVGRADEATAMSKEVLNLFQTTLGPAHTDSIKAMSSLAGHYWQANNRGKALEIREEIVALCEDHLGKRHRTTLQARNRLCNTLLSLDRRDEAIRQREDVLSLMETALPQDDPATLLTMHSLAADYARSGREDDSLELYEKALPLSRKINGPEHHLTLGAMTDLAGRYLAAGRIEEALELQEEALRIKRKVFPRDQRFTQVALSNLSMIYARLGRTLDSLAAALELLETRLELNGKQHEGTRRALDQVLRVAPKAGALHVWEGRENEHDKLCQRLLEITQGWSPAWTVERVARTANLRPLSDPAMRQEALSRAQKALEIAKEAKDRGWANLSIGVAQYRNGENVNADSTLAKPETKNPHIAQIAGYYRAMSLFKQGNSSAASQLFFATEEVMRPIPADLAISKTSFQNLMLWMAYKEASELLREPPRKWPKNKSSQAPASP